MQKSKLSRSVPLILIFAFAYLAGKAWNWRSSDKHTSKPAALLLPQTPALDRADDGTPIGAASTPAKFTKNTTTSPQTNTSNLEAVLEKGNGGPLFKSLFTEHALFVNPLNDAVKASLAKRFSGQYPQDYQLEMSSRLGILKALSLAAPQRQPSSVTENHLVGFYRKILANPNENWVVKRQAFRNLKSAVSAAELNQYYARLDNRVIRLSSQSEAELLQEVIGEKIGSR